MIVKNTLDDGKLWNKNFILFFVCTAQSALGASISGVALSFLVLELTGSISAMSITLALNFLPAILTPFLATFVDRMPLKPTMIFGILLRGVILISLYVALKCGFANIYGIYAMALVTGFITSFYGPASQSLIPFLIPKKQLPRGNSLLGTATNGMALAGLLFGGMLVGAFGPSLALLIEGVCYILSGNLLFSVNMPKSANANLDNSFWKDFILGLGEIKKSGTILLIMTMFFLINAIMSPIEVLLPVHMLAIGKGAFGYGVFMASIVGGMLIGNIVVAMLGNHFNSSRGVFYSWLGFAVSMVGLATLNAFSMSLCWGILFGINISVLNTSITSVLQEIVPVTFRARVFGSVGAVAQIGMPLSLFMFSYIAKKVTLGEVFIVGAILSVIFAVLWHFGGNKRQAEIAIVS